MCLLSGVIEGQGSMQPQSNFGLSHSGHRTSGLHWSESHWSPVAAYARSDSVLRHAASGTGFSSIRITCSHLLLSSDRHRDIKAITARIHTTCRSTLTMFDSMASDCRLLPRQVATALNLTYCPNWLYCPVVSSDTICNIRNSYPGGTFVESARAIDIWYVTA
jgi:hypothetical protein